MTKNLTLLLVLIAANTALCQPKNRTFERYNGTINLLGEATLDRLKEDPFMEWYEESYQEYNVDATLLDPTLLPDSITIFMGTWCGDSRREVPRFIKMLEALNYDFNKLKILCLNTGFQNYKQAPEREEVGMNIHRVPTFIFHDENQEEIGRIVEEPVVSFEQDFQDVILGKPYETYYPVANDLIQKLQEYPLNKLRKLTPKLIKEYQSKSVSEYELNTYGFVLWTSFDLMKAEFVFELNAKLHPESTTPLISLARFKEGIGKSKEAYASVKKGLSIEPENETLQELKNSMN